jgi:hemolysin III
MTRAEYVSDAVVHVTGVFLVAGAVPALILLTANSAHGGAVLGVSIYGTTLLLMIVASALYNMVLSERWAWLLCRLDHSAIYLKIAGTYSGFALIAGQGLSLLAVLWGVAAAGISLKVAAPDRYRRLGLILYLGMGWAGALLMWSLIATLPPAAVGLIVAGGMLYTAGVVFFLWDTLPHKAAVWHVFVLAASILVYSAMVVAVV